MAERKKLKDNKWKSRVDLITWEFLLGLGYVLKQGAEKYEENTRQGVDVKFHYAACLRHLIAFKKWEIYDKESWLEHLVHAATNIMFMQTNYKTQKDLFDNN